MNIWLITVGESMPVGNNRVWRTAMLAKMLSENNKVIRWTSTFDHQQKKYLYNENIKIKVNDNLSRFFLHSKIPYYKNVSFSRIKNHREVALNFEKESQKEIKPDLIYCSFPTIELAFSAVKFGEKYNIPVIVDVRDLWPDIFLDLLPNLLKPFGRVFLRDYLNKTKYIFKNASGITGVSKKYLDFGLKYAEREVTNKDGVFPLGYDDSVKVELNTEELEELSNLKINTNKINVWFVGSFGKTYDLSPVIKAARKIENKHSAVNFIFTGDGENMNKWVKEANGLENVIFTGWAGKKEIQYLSANSNIGLMAYAKGAPQGLPNKVFEYMASGLPILSSLQTETKDLLRDEQIGVTYQAENSESFIKELEKLIINLNKLEEMGVRSRKVFENNFKSEIIYNNLKEYLENQI
jgi:glycosyltransferase involved in cell wall biosynthesis